MHRTSSIVSVLATGLLSCTLFAGAADTAAGFPGKDAAETETRCAAVLKTGPDGIRELCGRLLPPGGADDTKIRYAVNGLARHVSAPGREQDRATFARAVCDTLRSARNDEVRAFLIRQLQLAGKDESVKALAGFLDAPRLCGPAARALAANGSNAAAGTLAAAVKTAGAAQKIDLVLALGSIRNSDDAKTVTGFLSGGSPELRAAARWALANTEAPAAVAPLMAAAEKANGTARFAAVADCLLLARRLAEKKDDTRAADICKTILAAAKKNTETHIRCAALDTLVAVAGALIAALLETKDGQAAAPIQAAIGTLSPAGVAKAAAGALAGADTGARVTLIGLLGATGTAEHGDPVMAQLGDDDPAVRTAALKALDTLASAQHAPALVARVLNSEGKERAAAERAAVSACNRIADEDKRAAPLLDAMAGTEDTIALLPLLAKVGGKKALAKTAAAADSADAEINAAAAGALADWSDPAALPHLRKPAGDTTNLSRHVLALRGIIRLAVASGKPPAEKAGILKEAINAAKRTEEKRLALGNLAAARCVESLMTAAAYLDDPALKGEAVVAVADIACPGPDGAAGLTGEKVVSVMQKALPAAPEGEAKKRIETHLVKITSRNIARGKPVVHASLRHEGNHVPSNAVDGDTSNNSGWWAGGSPATIEIDLQSATEVAAARVFFYHDGGRYYQYTLAVSQDRKTWKTVVDMSRSTTISAPAGALHTFDPVTARYVRLSVLKNSANPSVHLNELEIYPAGRVPEPGETAAAPGGKALPVYLAGTPDDEGFYPLFNGKDLSGWIGATKGYVVEDGCIVCLKKGGGNLYTRDRYDDFVLRFEFTLTPGANNGLGIRVPPGGHAAYDGMELQIIDNTAKKYAKLQPWQYHGSIYGVVPAKRGHLKPAGAWNTQEVTADGRRIAVVLNNATIVDANLDEVTPIHDKKHPGLARMKGHIGFLGHGARVAFRNIRIKPIARKLNTPPPGFTALFNGKDLANWKGLLKRPYDNPVKRAALDDAKRAALQKEADAHMKKHWSVTDGLLRFDGKGHSLATEKKYADFEMYVDWKIRPKGDSGIYLRGTPQVQIWDPANPAAHRHGADKGSGGLWNNRKHERFPLHKADNPAGEWNTFHIRMVGEKVTILLNGVLIVDGVVLENCWDRKKPIFGAEQIELQCHGHPVDFRNIFIREIGK